MSAKKVNVAVAGATGAVGGAMLDVLERRNFPVNELRLLASERSIGKKLKYKGEELPVQLLSKDAFAGIDIALFSAGAARSLERRTASGGSVVALGLPVFGSAGRSPDRRPRARRRCRDGRARLPGGHGPAGVQH